MTESRDPREALAARDRAQTAAGTFHGVAEAPDLDLLAASLRADTSDTAAFLEALATKLEDALPGQVDVERKGRLFGGSKSVRRIAVRVGDTHYEIEGAGGVVSARRRSVVRGIALKSQDLELEAWIDGLSGDLLVLAQRSEQGRLALERLLTD